jgi:hypothetical protein
VNYLEMALKVSRDRQSADRQELENRSASIPSARAATCAASCYEIEPGRWIHHPWDNCVTSMPLQLERRKAEAVCWHCDGERRCPCSTCWAGGPGECIACRGNGKIRTWLQ